MTDSLDQAARLADVTERLIRETAGLRRDVAQLVARLPGPERTEYDMPPGKELLPFRDMKDLVARVRESRRAIGDAERHLNAIRALLRDVVDNEASRAVWSEAIKRPPKSKGPG